MQSAPTIIQLLSSPGWPIWHAQTWPMLMMRNGRLDTVQRREPNDQIARASWASQMILAFKNTAHSHAHSPQECHRSRGQHAGGQLDAWTDWQNTHTQRERERDKWVEWMCKSEKTTCHKKGSFLLTLAMTWNRWAPSTATLEANSVLTQISKMHVQMSRLNMQKWENRNPKNRQPWGLTSAMEWSMRVVLECTLEDKLTLILIGQTHEKIRGTNEQKWEKSMPKNRRENAKWLNGWMIWASLDGWLDGLDGLERMCAGTDGMFSMWWPDGTFPVILYFLGTYYALHTTHTHTIVIKERTTENRERKFREKSHGRSAIDLQIQSIWPG